MVPLLLIAMLVLAACGGGGDDAPAAEAPASEAPAAGSAQEAIAQVLDVVAGDLYFGETPDNLANPPVWTVNAGEPFQVNLDNQGGLQHNWAIVNPGTEVPVPFDPAANSDVLLWDAGIVEPGQTGSNSFTVNEPGEYTVICTVAGHYPAMQGRLVVE
jgi:uncharacterized cupredoxin-like copper-binding protein